MCLIEGLGIIRPRDGARMILKSEAYHFHRLDLTRQAGFIVTIYDEDGLRLANTPPLPTPAQAFASSRSLGASCRHEDVRRLR